MEALKINISELGLLGISKFFIDGQQVIDFVEDLLSKHQRDKID
jgi:hypothetical protein